LTQKEKNSRTTNNIVESISPHKEKYTPTQSGQRRLKTLSSSHTKLQLD